MSPSTASFSMKGTTVSPAGTNRTRLRGVLFCADAAPADSAIRLADSNRVARRMRSPREKQIPARCRGLPFSFALRQNCYSCRGSRNFAVATRVWWQAKGGCSNEIGEGLPRNSLPLSPLRPAPCGNGRPDRLDEAERPGALQESVHRTERAGDGECQDEPVAAILGRIADQHHGDGEQAEEGQCIQWCCPIDSCGDCCRFPTNGLSVKNSPY